MEEFFCSYSKLLDNLCFVLVPGSFRIPFPAPKNLEKAGILCQPFFVVRRGSGARVPHVIVIGQPEVGYPDPDRLPAKLHQFVTPVKLERFARVKELRDVCGNLLAFSTVAPFLGKALDAVIAA